MKVCLSSIQYPKTVVKNVTFGDTSAKSHNMYRPDLDTHHTYLGRGYFDRTKVANHAIDLILNNKENVEFVFCGCSDGSEVFEMVMELKSQFGKQGISMDKFPKIKAFDKKSELIDIAKKGRINLSETGMKYIRELYPEYKFFTDEASILKIEGDNLKHFEEATGHKIKHSYQFDKDLMDKIQFYSGNMLEEFKNLDSKNRKIIFCRNVARYNSDTGQRQAASMLAKKLKQGSLVVVGFRDEHNILKSEIQPFCMDKYRALPFVDEMRKTNFAHRYDLSSVGTIYQKITFLPKNKFLKAIVKLFK